MINKKWEKEEIDFLFKNRNALTSRDFSKALGRSISSVSNKIIKLKIFKEDIVKIGYILNNLTIIDFVFKNKKKLLVCRCICGNITKTNRNTFLKGFKKSCGCMRGKEPGEATWNAYYREYRHGAKKRNYVFNLNIEQFKDICSNNCYYCDKEPRPVNHYVDEDGKNFRKDVKSERVDKSWVKMNGIDRIDNTLGYTVENCMSCCYTCNRMKSDLTEQEFLEKIKKIYEFKTGVSNGK